MRCSRIFLALILTALLGPNLLLAQKLDMDLFEAMKPRNIGPAGMSGRVTSIDAVHSNPDIIYAGTASGGLWKSTSGGINWTSLFDDEPTHSIGVVAINQSNPDIVWVGAGEGNPRNSQSAGNGLYKTIDGGVTWKHLGLEDSRNIHRIILDPNNPDVALIGVQGPAWGETEDRGVFRTTDGGKTLEKVLYINEKTGIGDMVVDPSNPNHVLAAMWEFRRWPWFFESGGEGSGLHESWDGGQTWSELTDEDGLPKGELGRMGLAFAYNEPDIVYALIEAKKNALYRSDDGGRKWKMINDDDGVNSRPFYYADIYVDPENENRIYKIETYVHISEDGGKSFRQWQPGYASNGIHPDHHAFWVSPVDPDPRYDLDMNAARARLALYADYEKLLETAAEMMTQIRKAKEAVETVDRSLGDREDDLAEALKKHGKTVADSLSALQDMYFGEQGKQGIYRDPNTVGRHVSGASSYIFSSTRPPNTPEDWSMSKGRRALNTMLEKVNGFLTTEWLVYKEAVEASDAFRIDDLEAVQMK